jgi:hypothetical protein
MGDPMRDDPSLAAACPSQDQERPLGMDYRFALLGIQPLEKIHEQGNTLDFTMIGAGILREPFEGTRDRSGVPGPGGTSSAMIARKRSRARVSRSWSIGRSGVATRLPLPTSVSGSDQK